MQWLMLQQELPEDFVIATGQQVSVRRFIELAVECIGVKVNWHGSGIREVATVVAVDKEISPDISVGQEIVKVDPKYFRPTEVETLLGDATKAKIKLGWVPEISLNSLVEEMVAHDMREAKKLAHLERLF
jgi:GDPmannose 4,6-dehydratase